MTFKTWALMSVVIVSLGGCAINDCDWAQPIRPNAADILSDDTVSQILTHNETGAAICGWRR